MNERGMLLMESISDLRDDWVLDSAALPRGGSVGKPPREGRFRRFTESPLAAAVISLTVAAAVLAGIVAAGRRASADPGGIPIGSTDSETVTETEPLPETVDPPMEEVYTCRLVLDEWKYPVGTQRIPYTLVATEPGKRLLTHRNYGFYRVEYNREILLYQDQTEEILSAAPEGTDGYAALSTWIDLDSVREAMERQGLGELTPGTYRVRFDDEYADIRIFDPDHVPSATPPKYLLSIEETKYPVSSQMIRCRITAKEPGVSFMEGINYSFYRLDGERETLLYVESVDGIFESSQPAPGEFAVLDMYVNLYNIRNHMKDNRLGQLTAGLYRIQWYDGQYVDIELYDPSESARFENPLSSRQTPSSIAVVPLSEDSAYERYYTDTQTCQRMMEAVSAWEMVYAPHDADPPNEGLTIHLLFGEERYMLNLRGDRYVTCHDLETEERSPTLMISKEDMDALYALIASTPSD